MLDGELHSRGLPRAFLDYADFLADWQARIERLEQQLGITFPKKVEAKEQVEDLIDLNLRHHSSDVDDLKLSSVIPTSIYSTYDLLARLVHNPNDHDTLRELDLIRTEFDNVSQFFGSTIKEYYGQLTKNTAYEFQKDEEINGLKTKAESLSSELSEVRRDLENARCDIEVSQKNLEQATLELENAASTVKSTARTLDRASRELEVMRRSRSWRLTRPLRAVASFMRRIST